MLHTKYVLLVCGIAIGGCLIYKSQTPLAYHSEQAEEHQDAKSEKAVTASQASKIISVAPSAQNPVALTPVQKIDHWQSEINKSRQYFRNTQEGYALALVAGLHNLEAEKNEHSKSFEQAKNYMEKHPEACFKELMSSMDKLPPEMNSARSYLVQTVVKLELHEQDKIALLRKDLAYQRTSKANDGSQFSAAITFDALMDVTNDQELLMSEAQKLAQAYRQSPQVYTALQRYAARYPASAKAVKQSLSGKSK